MLIVVQANKEAYEFIYIPIPKNISRVPEAMKYIKEQSPILKDFFEGNLNYSNKIQQSNTQAKNRNAPMTDNPENVNNMNPQEKNPLRYTLLLEDFRLYSHFCKLRDIIRMSGFVELLLRIRMQGWIVQILQQWRGL